MLEIKLGEPAGRHFVYSDKCRIESIDVRNVDLRSTGPNGALCQGGEAAGEVLGGQVCGDVGNSMLPCAVHVPKGAK